MSILIVDDSEDVRKTLEVLLKRNGYCKVMSAVSAQDAFDILDMEDSGIDLILLDIVMPEMNGIVFCQTIKEMNRFRDIPVIMVTGNTATEKLELAFEAGAVDYVTKPFNNIELIARVRSAIRLKKEMDERKAKQEELALRNQQLENAQKEIKVLRDLIPTCAYCKKVWDDDGYWKSVEAYVTRHYEARFSHGICEACAKEHFPNLQKKM